MGFNREMTGRQLKAFREGLGLTQQKLADILDVQRVTVARAESGKYRKKAEVNPDKEISRLLQMLLKEAFGAGKLQLPVAVVRQPSTAEYGKKDASGVAVVREPGAEYGKKP